LNKKGFIYNDILHLTKQNGFACFSKVICRISLQFLLSLPQMAAVKYITQVLGGDNRR